jgi:tetratricopeptide (TPR) repeat protein
MASTTRIEELEKKFNENPRRYFAPLANEYRKAGDLEQAIAICRTYVPQQPAHMSGHIVFGQALFEAGEHEEARGVFEAALALDPENLIALRHLGDIARERGEIGAARTWYRRVLDADPRNDEVVALMGSLDTAAPAAAPSGGGLPSWPDINPERTLELPPGLLEAEERSAAEITADPFSPSPALLREPSPLETTLQPPPPLAAHHVEIPEVIAPDADDHARGVDEANAGPDYPHLDLVLPEPGQPAPPPAGPAPIEPVWGHDDAEADAASAPTGVTEGLEVMEFAPPPRAPVAEAAPIEPPAEDTPAVFVTETMAELYLQQGFREEALNVYRQLLAQNPHDATLRDRVEQIERDVRPSADVVSATRDSVVGLEVDTPQSIQPSARAFFAVLAQRRVRHDHGPSDDSPSGEESPDREHHEQPPSAISSPPSVDVHEAASSPEIPAAIPEVRDVPAEEQSPPTRDYPGAREMESDVAAAATEQHHHHEQPAAAHEESAGPSAGRDAPRRDSLALEHIEYPETSLGSTGQAVDFDVVAYEASEVVEAPPAENGRAMGTGAGTGEAEGSGGAVPVEGTTAAPSVPASAEPVRPEADALHDAREEPVDGGNGVAPAASPRKPMQTGSVNVLFPQQSIAASDEAAAATLSDAFGGPSPSAAVPPREAPRPAANELSLDSIFRESSPPQEPQRQPTAFSFDRFFTDSSTAPASGVTEQPPASDTATPEGADPMAADAEQFSNWLAGLKKK